MAYTSSLTDQEWAIIEPLLPQKQKTRPPKWTKRQILDGIFYQQTSCVNQLGRERSNSMLTMAAMRLNRKAKRLRRLR
jgi:hypothetical protein